MAAGPDTGRFLVEGEWIPTLPDLLAPGLRVLFVGYNPSIRAARLGHYYAGRGNRFWEMLAGSGLIPRRLAPQDDHLLPDFGLGVTDLVKRPTRSAAEVSRDEYLAGAARLAGIVGLLRPRVVCYNGKGVYLLASRRARAEWGLQADSLVPGVRDFVAPSPSGLARLPLAEKVSSYRELERVLRAVETETGISG